MLRVRRLAQATRRFHHGCSSSVSGDSGRPIMIMVMSPMQQSSCRMALLDHHGKNQADGPA